MEIEIKEDSDIVTITCNGDINIGTIRNFKQKLFEISCTTNKNIDFNLSNVGYIDSSGIGILISLMKLQNKKGKNLNIKMASPKIIDVLKLSSLSDVFGISG